MHFKKSLALLALMVLTFSGCQGSSEPQVYTLNEEAPAGEFVYQINLAEKLEAIPSANTSSEYEAIAADLPAQEGYVWVHLKGSLSNPTQEPAVLSEDKLGIVDSEGTSYTASVEASMYVEAEASVFYIVVAPTSSADWEAYFEVPMDAMGLQFNGFELRYVPGSEVPQGWVAIDLGF